MFTLDAQARCQGMILARRYCEDTHLFSEYSPAFGHHAVPVEKCSCCYVWFADKLLTFPHITVYWDHCFLFSFQFTVVW